MFDLFSGPHMLILLVIVLLIFGPKNLPRLAQSLGQSVRELKKGLQGLNDDIKEPPKAPPTQQATAGPVPGTQAHTAQPFTPAGDSAAEPADPTKNA